VVRKRNRPLESDSRPRVCFDEHDCGEHGGEPSSVKFCRGLGLDYVSCSPFRVPIARLAAAQANDGGTSASEGGCDHGAVACVSCGKPSFMRFEGIRAWAE
jgi:hypothetical protein